MNPYQVDRLRMRELGIKFLGSAGKESSPPLPNHLIRTITQVTEFGDYKFSTYCNDDLAKAGHQPIWREETKARARRIVETTVVLVAGAVSELEWRLRLEELVLARFRLEIECPTCGKRIWRSHVEAIPEVDDMIGTKLRERREDRQSCKCQHSRWSLGLPAIGINKIFSSRADELVLYDPFEAPADSPKDKLRQRRPDRIVGFQETHSIGEALDRNARLLQDDAGLKTIRETVECTVLNHKSGLLLFPFLVIEAKSDSGDNFTACDAQTAFPIWKMLKIQEELQAKSRLKLTYGGPLLWYIAYRGNEWRVHACYTDNIGGKHSYGILQLWSGDLSKNDEALQLLLIMDYIFDWARDIYKQTIMTLLKSLRVTQENGNDKGGTIAEIATDTDIFSHAGGGQYDPTSVWVQDVYQARLPSLVEDFDLRSWRVTDMRDCFFRPACFVTSHFQCLYITADDVEKFVAELSKRVEGKENSRGIPQKLVLLERIDKILQHNNCIVTENGLRRMEEIWSSRARPQPPQQAAEKKFFATVVYHTEICGNFEIERSLTCIALESGALIALRKLIATMSVSFYTAEEVRKWQEPVPPALNRAGTLTELKIETLLHDILDLSIGDTLKAAIGGKRKLLRLEPGSKRSTNFEFFEPKDSDKSARAKNFITMVYEWAREEPGKPIYLRFSQNTSTSINGLRASALSPNTSSTASASENYVMVLFVQGTPFASAPESYRLCLYEISGRTISPSKAELAIALKATHQKGTYFHCGYKSNLNDTVCCEISKRRCYYDSGTFKPEPTQKSWIDWMEAMSQYLPQPKTIPAEATVAMKKSGSAEEELATNGPKSTEETSISSPSTAAPRSLEIRSASTAPSSAASTLGTPPLVGGSALSTKRKLQHVDAGGDSQVSNKFPRQRGWDYNGAGVTVR